jgi:hypothetical protein
VLLSKILDIYLEELEPIKHVNGIIPAICFQPINHEEISRFKKNGGNALGIEESDAPLIRTFFPYSFSDSY